MRLDVRLLRAAGAAIAATSASAAAQTAPDLPPRIPEILLLESGDYGDAAMIRRSAARDGFRGWVLPADYPQAARREGREAQIFFDVAVGADDRITGCTVQMVQGNGDDFAERACEIVRQRGQFRHALDAEGRARPGIVTMVMTFTLRQPQQPSYAPGPAPGMGPRLQRPAGPARPNALTLRGPPTIFVSEAPTAWLDIDARGRVTRCRIRSSTATDEGDASLCRHVARTRFLPAVGLDGEPVATESYYARFTVQR
jgi:hypothetical protein